MTEPGDRNTAGGGAADHVLGIGLPHRDHIAGLVLAEPEGVRGRPPGRRGDLRPDPRGHRHLGERHQEAAVGEVVRGTHKAGPDQEIAETVCFLASERAGFISGLDCRVDGGTVPTI